MVLWLVQYLECTEYKVVTPSNQENAIRSMYIELYTFDNLNSKLAVVTKVAMKNEVCSLIAVTDPGFECWVGQILGFNIRWRYRWCKYSAVLFFLNFFDNFYS